METVMDNRARVMGVALAVLTALLAAQLMLGTAGAGSGAVAVDTPWLATQLGISATAARRLFDLFGSWYFTIAIAAITGGWGAGLVAIAKRIALRYGRRYALAW